MKKENNRDRALRQYWEERKAQIKRLPKSEADVFIQRVRLGDLEAKEALILDCLYYVEYMALLAYRKAQCRGKSHECDFLDIIQVGNLVLVEEFDRCMVGETSPGIAYLKGVIKGKIALYCDLKTGMIPIPGRQMLDKQPSVESLHAKLQEAAWTEIELVLSFQAGAEKTASATNAEELYAPLYEAIQKLPLELQEVLNLHYGLEGYPEVQLLDLWKQLGYKSPSSIYWMHKKALRELRKLLLPKK